MDGAEIHTYHQQWPQAPNYHLHSSPYGAVTAPPLPLPPPFLVDNPDRTTTDEVRTIFITGLPEDVKERELQNLLRWFPGYEASQINSKGEHPMGFVLFSTAQMAVAAIEALQDMVFDAELNSVLRAEMAKKNLFIKRGIVADSSPHDQSKRMRTGGDYTHSAYSNLSPFHPPPAPFWGPHGYLPPPIASYDPYGGYSVPPVQIPAPGSLPGPNNYIMQNVQKNTKDNPPCNTLFIGNLGENTSEEELTALFSAHPGYKQMKILRHDRHTVCFVEFEDVNTATEVHNALQGAVIPISCPVGMRMQYSKNPFGKRKDGIAKGSGAGANEAL